MRGLGERSAASAACIDPVRVQNPAEGRIGMYDIVNCCCAREPVCTHVSIYRREALQRLTTSCSQGQVYGGSGSFPSKNIAEAAGAVKRNAVT